LFCTGKKLDIFHTKGKTWIVFESTVLRRIFKEDEMGGSYSTQQNTGQYLGIEHGRLILNPYLLNINDNFAI